MTTAKGSTPDWLPKDSALRHGVVIVTRDASRSGAPLTALNLSKALIRDHGIPVVSVLRAGGPLEGEFHRLGPVFHIPSSHLPGAFHAAESRPLLRLAKHAVYAVGQAVRARHWRRLHRFLKTQRIGHAICNTVLSGSAAAELKAGGIQVIGLAHELTYSIRFRNWTGEAKALIANSQALIVAGSSIRDAYRAEFPAASTPIHIVPQSHNIDPASLTNEYRLSHRGAVRTRLGLAEEDVMVMGCGTADLRKGVDFFVQTAREMAIGKSFSLPNGGRIVLVWLGNIEPGYRVWAEKDIIELGMQGRLIFLRSTPDAAPHYAAADIFFQCSREDPFPNVVLEAMASGLPVVGFAGTGGVEEQVGNAAGVIVPYADTKAAAEQLHRLALAPDMRLQMGGSGRARIDALGGFTAYAGRLLGIMSQYEQSATK